MQRRITCRAVTLTLFAVGFLLQARGFEEVFQLMRTAPRLGRAVGTSALMCSGGYFVDDAVRFSEERQNWEARCVEAAAMPVPGVQGIVVDIIDAACGAFLLACSAMPAARDAGSVSCMAHKGNPPPAAEGLSPRSPSGCLTYIRIS